MPSAQPSKETRPIDCQACMAKGAKLQPYAYTPRPLGPHDVEIAIDHCGVCGTDISQIDNAFGITQYPLVVGHEIVGRVTDLGAHAHDLHKGDTVCVGYICATCENGDCDSCIKGRDAYCPQSVLTAGGQYSDGSPTRGGFASSVRVQAKHAIRVPPQLDPAEAAPLVCAGVTVFAPMVRFHVQAGDRVGVIGIGGLGHLALQFARALGADVTAFTTKDSKRDECTRLGAHHVVNINDADQVQAAADSIDFMLVASNSPHLDWNQLASFVALHGKIVLVAAPEVPITLNAPPLIMKDIQINTSLVGNMSDIQRTLEFAAQHDIHPMMERLDMKDCNEGLRRVREGKARYRVVLSN
ncbi:hypothetical protein BJ085DRAFT_37327 [Dimargaris cristalligena]|uniref:Enoyl reductase (ER) domain-containing protein n=1 Tax=Dimargaris cristalligena TaxID=215637 RepID=A0A4P9ZPV9_9FUNG|nr:hypothetical protein BJ085DRAFT_37327 [Dimargaris cristalligena]|eukprot:RKP35357.1 hypothetical protein BJ085DRAFT_37327 [Dimargaris cristalligena]